MLLRCGRTGERPRDGIAADLARSPVCCLARFRPGTAQRVAKAQLDLGAAKAKQASLEKMAPIWQKPKADATFHEIEAQKAQAIQGMAAIDQQRLWLESQALGQSQIFTPNGFVPYPYGIAQPIVPFPYSFTRSATPGRG